MEKRSILQKAILILFLLTGSISFVCAAPTEEPDSTFDKDGIAYTEFVDESLINDQAILSDNSIISVGTSYKTKAGESYFALSRHGEKGNLLGLFGSTGMIEIKIKAKDTAYAVSHFIIDADTLIVAAGTSNGDLALACYSSLGKPNDKFGTDGIVTKDLGGKDIIYDVEAVLEDGKPFIYAAAYGGGKPTFQLLKYDLNGDLVTDFGEKGIIQVAIEGTHTPPASLIYDEGSGVVFCGASDNGKTDLISYAKYYPESGKAIESFGEKGISQIEIKASTSIHDACIHEHDSVEKGYLATGNAGTSYITTKVLATSGELDKDFGGSGIVTTNFGSTSAETAKGIATQSDGKIIVGGELDFKGTYIIAMTRYNYDGSDDKTYASGGVLMDMITDENIHINAVSVQEDGKILVGGMASNQVKPIKRFFIIRYLNMVITDQPESQARCDGGDAFFEVNVKGCDYKNDVSYQWAYFNGTKWEDIVGANDHNITLKSISSTHEGYYCCYLGYRGNPLDTTNVALLEVLPTPAVDLGEDTTVCSNISLLLDAENPGYSFIWNTGDSTQTIEAASPGSYEVTVTDGLSCEDRDTIQISHYPAPEVDLGNDTSICNGQVVMLDAGPGVDYQWSTGQTSQFVGATATDTYSVTVTNADGCTGSDEINITVLPPPNVDLGNDTSICTGESISLDAGNPGYSYQWSTTETSQTIVADTTGDYAVTVTDGNTCTDSDTLSLTLLPVPQVNLGNDTSICNGSFVQLDAENSGSDYIWTTGQTSQTIAATSTDLYGVTVTNTDGCSESDEINITVLPPPSVDLGNDTSICTGETVTLDAGNPGYTYQWSTTESTQTIDVATGGDFAVTVTDGASCTDADTINITLLPTPVVNLGNDTTIEFGEYVTLDAGNAGSDYLWSTTETSRAIIADASGDYSVTVTNSDGCSASDTITVSVNPTKTNSTDANSSLTVYPNPYQTSTSIKLSLDEKSNVVLEVFNLLGNKVAIIENNLLETGNYSYNFSAKALNEPEGIYFLKTIINDKEATIKLIELK